MMKNLILSLFIVLMGSYCYAQGGLEGVIVEEVDASLAGEGQISYRVFIDLAPGFELQQVFGNSEDQLTIATTTAWFNDAFGTPFGHENNEAFFPLAPSLAFDSYVSLGAGSNTSWGVLQSDAPSGLANLGPVNSVGILTLDPPIPGEMDVAGNFAAGATSNSLVAAIDGQFFTLTSNADVAPGNRILLGQFTTDGAFSFALNIQTRVAGTADFTVLRAAEVASLNYPVAGCVSDADCNDDDACTTDVCEEGTCVNTPIDCDDQDACTTDSCDPSDGCINTPIDCDDQDACTTDSCEEGLCVNTAIDCDDQDACTTDSCEEGLCVNTAIDCDDQDACTTDSCEEGLCVNTAIDCDDQDACTTDSCEEGLCVNTAIDCDDQDACTTDSCEEGLCVNTEIDCDDGDPATTDSCVDGECQNVITECDDQDACTTDELVDGVCVYTDVDCDDGDACTTDSCDPSDGCINTPIDCDDQDACTTDSCEEGLCVNTAIDCDDQDACTTDSCEEGLCVNTEIDCDDGDPATTDSCVDGECVNVVEECNDNDACTTDELVDGVCVFTPVDCDDQDACTTDSCDSATGCINTPIDCDDQDACTTDSCADGECVNTPIDCDDADACTTDSCDDGECVNTPIDCDDGDPTTEDFCVDGECVNDPIGTPANDLCDDAASVECGDVVDGTTTNSTVDLDGQACIAGSNNSGGVFYSIMGNGLDVTVNTCAFANFDTRIAVLSGSCDALVCEAANDDACGLQSEVTFSSVIGVEYFIYVTGFNTSFGDFTLTVSCEDDCPAPVNDNAEGALANTPDRLWGVPGWDTFDVGCATLSAQACDESSPTSDSWYSFVAQAENQGILARANPADPNAANVDMAVEVFDATLTPLAGTTGGDCEESRSCFNNAGAGEIERCVPGGLTIGDTYYYRVYDAAGAETGTSLLVDTKVKTYASHPIVEGCDEGGASIADNWTIEDPSNLYNIPPVPVFNVRMVIKDLSGAIVATAAPKNPAEPGGLSFSLAEFSPSLAGGDYTIHAQNEVKMMANGCVSSYWSQCGPGCDLSINVDPTEVLVGLTGTDANWSFIAYPNPNEGDQVFISMDKIADVNQAIIVEVFDMYGKRVHSEQFAGAGSDVNKILTFDQNLSSGLYLINLTVNEMIVTKKLIVQ